MLDIVRASFDARSWRRSSDVRVSVVDFLSTVHFFARVDLGLRARAEDGGEAAVTAAGKPPHLDLPEAADAPKRVAAGDVALEAREGRRVCIVTRRAAPCSTNWMTRR